MPTLTVTLSAAAANELTDAFGTAYQATIQTGVDANGGPIMGANPETKNVFARRQVIALLKQHVLLYRKRQAAATMAPAEPDIT